MMRNLLIATLIAAMSALPVLAAETLTLQPQRLPEWKAVYGRVEARDLVPARARIGGIVVELLVSEGDSVTEGQRIALVRDDKIAFQIAAYDAQLRAFAAQLEIAETELARGQSLLDRGVVSTQRLDQLRTDVDVTRNQIAAAEAQRSVMVQQSEEGAVLAPAAGRVLSVPLTQGAVIMAGEVVATIGGGGFYLRLAIPERHAHELQQDTDIRITAGGTETTGRLAKIYPQIESGRVIADVEIEHLDAAFVDARALVQVPIATREALVVPQSALTTRSGLDFVQVSQEGRIIERAVVPGGVLQHDGTDLVEILTGLAPGETIIVP